MTTEVLNLRRKLRALLRRWSQRQSEYGVASLKSALDTNRNRYEGIGTGTRWCAEDIQDLMKALK